MFKDAARVFRFATGWRAAYLVTIILSALVYLPAMSGLLIWDDHALIGGYGIGGGKSLGACFSEPFLSHYFRPLVSVSFFIDHAAQDRLVTHQSVNSGHLTFAAAKHLRIPLVQ